MTQERANSKLAADRQDKENDLRAVTDVKLRKNQWNTVIANQTLGCFGRRVASRLRKHSQKYALNFVWSCVGPGIGRGDPYGSLPTWIFWLHESFTPLLRWSCSEMLPPEWGHLGGKGCGETGKGPAVRQGPWAYALQGDVQGAGVKHDEDDCKKQNGRSLHVFKEKVQRCLSRTSFSVNRQYKKKWQLQTVAGRVGLGQFRKKLSSLGE